MDPNRSTESYVDIDRAIHVINTFLPWLLILFGIIFNILIILGMRTKNFRSLSTSVFMIAGAVNDVISIPILLFAHWLHVNFPEAIVRGNGSDVMCKFFNFYGWGQADFGILLISAMTADRAYAILRPMTTIDLVKRAKIVTGLCVGVVVAKEFHFWFSSVTLSKERKDRLCDVAYTSAIYHEFYQSYWPWLDTAYVTFCFIMMTASNCALVRYIRKNRKEKEWRAREYTPAAVNQCELSHRSSSSMSVHARTSYSSVSNQITKMLVAESLALFFLSYPFYVYGLVTSQINDLHTNPARTKANALAFNVVLYLQYARKCVSFLVYYRSGKKFRKAIVSEVLCRCPCVKYLLRWSGRASEFGDNSLQSPSQTQSSGNSQTRLMPLWQNVTSILCVYCKGSET